MEKFVNDHFPKKDFMDFDKIMRISEREKNITTLSPIEIN